MLSIPLVASYKLDLLVSVPTFGALLSWIPQESSYPVVTEPREL